MKTIADIAQPQPEVMASCGLCHTEFPYTPLSDMSEFRPTVCSDCGDKLAAREALEKRMRQRNAMLKRLPFTTFDPHKGNTGLLNTAGLMVFKDKRLTEKGIYIHGPSRTCKTRVLCALAIIALDRGYSVGFRSCPHMLRAYSQSLLDGSMDGLLARLHKPDVLIIDDFGEGKLTERGLELLYMIVDKRLILQKPVWFTSNLALNHTINWMAHDTLTRIRATRILTRIDETTDALVSQQRHIH